MNDVITERSFPIEGKWIFKSIIFSIFLLLFFLPTMYLELTHGRFSPFVFFYFAALPIHLTTFYLQKINFHYSLEDKFMQIQQGIISKQQRHIPYGVIQNIFIKQDLLDRIFGISSLIIENASQGGMNQDNRGNKIFGLKISNQKRQQSDWIGFSGNRVTIPGLTRNNAEMLKEVVLKKMKENPIEDGQSGL